MTSKPFGVNITILPALIPADYDAYARVVAEEKVALLEIAGGNPKKYTKWCHENGHTKVLHKSATFRHALKAEKAGVDLVEIVGYEASIAGGQPGDEIGAWVMLAKACRTLKIPVIASGASAVGSQLAAAISMGACGITMATRFLATKEAPIRNEIKVAMAKPENDERSTVVVMGPLNNATRVFKNTVSIAINDILGGADDVEFSSIQPLASGQRTKAI